MLSISLRSFDRECSPTTGGISDIWIFDRDDFNFTQAAATNGDLPAYSAIALREGATAEGGALLYHVDFSDKSAEYRYAQSLNNEVSVKVEHTVEFLMADLDNFITQWNVKVDAAAACHGIGVIVRLNSGKIFVLGEKYVNDERQLDWKMKQNGSTGTSGKLREDVNGQTTLLVGDFGRTAYEYSGSVSSLESLSDTGS
jgi:hypothetical protein